MTSEIQSLKFYSLPYGNHTLPYIWSVTNPLIFLVYDFPNNDWLDLIEPLSVFKYTVQNNVETAIIARTEVVDSLKITKRISHPSLAFCANLTRFQIQDSKFTIIQLLKSNVGEAELAMLESVLEEEDQVLIVGAIKSEKMSSLAIKKRIRSWRKKYGIIEVLPGANYETGTPMCLTSSELNLNSKAWLMSNWPHLKIGRLSQKGVMIEVYPPLELPEAELQYIEKRFGADARAHISGTKKHKGSSISNSEQEVRNNGNEAANSTHHVEIPDHPTTEDELSRLGFYANDSSDMFYDSDEQYSFDETDDESDDESDG